MVGKTLVRNCCWAALSLVLVPIGTAQSLRTVAFTGLPADDGAEGTGSYGLFGTTTLNNDGHTAFLAQLIPNSGTAIGAVWSEAGGAGARLVAADTRPAPGVPNAVFASLSNTQPFINDAGQTLFRGNLAVGVGGVTSSNNSGIWIADPWQAPTLVLREGDPVPGSTATFSEQTGVSDRSFARFNSAGQATVHHRLTGASSTTDFGIWVEAIGQSTVQLAREGSFAAGYPAGSAYYGSLAASPTMNDLGVIAFYGTVVPFPGQASSGEVIWIGTPGNVQRILRNGDPAPGLAGATFVDLETPSINNAGGYAFSGFTDTDVTGVWTSRTGGPLELAYQGYEQPFHSHGENAIEFFGTVLLNAAGELAFTSNTLDVPGVEPPVVDQATNASLWSDAGGAGLREVAREGDQPVGTPSGVEYAAFSDPAINALGQVAFLADLRGVGVTSANNQALFAEDAAGSLHLIARKGDLLDVDDGPGVDERTISALGFWGGSGNEDGRRSAFNDSGQLAFTAAFTGSTAGVFVSSRVATNDDVPGDFNGDQIVDAADYTVWRDHLGADFDLSGNGDESGASAGVVDQADYDYWKSHFDQGGGAGAVGVAPAQLVVPEPATALLLVTGTHFLAVFGRKRRRA